MPLTFSEDLNLAPMPASPRAVAAQAVSWTEAAATLGGLPAAMDAAVNRIYAVADTAPPTEVRRLWLLYQRAYTRAEVTGLVANTVAGLGIAQVP